jgi:FKBP-type peptidyl-prolyl cis-trans isomerase
LPLVRSPGLAEAVAIMVVGERRRLWIPAALAFPSDPDEAPPERKADLTYDLALMEIIAAPPTPPTLTAPPRRARRLPSAVAVEILKKGNGQVHPGAANQLTLHLAAWSRDGTLVESTRMGGQPAVFRIAELVPGLREGVRQLAVGDVARLWIPAALAYGDRPRRRGQPAGPLVYEIDCSGWSEPAQVRFRTLY